MLVDNAAMQLVRDPRRVRRHRHREYVRRHPLRRSRDDHRLDRHRAECESAARPTGIGASASTNRSAEPRPTSPVSTAQTPRARSCRPPCWRAFRWANRPPRPRSKRGRPRARHGPAHGRSERSGRAGGRDRGVCRRRGQRARVGFRRSGRRPCLSALRPARAAIQPRSVSDFVRHATTGGLRRSRKRDGSTKSTLLGGCRGYPTADDGRLGRSPNATGSTKSNPLGACRTMHVDRFGAECFVESRRDEGATP